MSVGNLKDQGNKGNNFPYQLKNLQLLGQIANAAKAVNLIEKSFSSATSAGIEAAVDGYFISNPDKILISKSVVYDSTASKFVAFLTLSSI
jgi:hypothetical protein